MSSDFSRRDFLRLSLISTAAIGCSAHMQRTDQAIELSTEHGAGGTVLFQGDSITDSGRNRNIAGPNIAAALGTGYPLMVAAEVLRTSPNYPWRFLNRADSGDKVPDLQARWSVDALALKPDILSVLVGVNDFWHKRLNGYTGTVSDYEAQYVALLTATRSALPTVRLVVLEPFVLRYGVVDATWFPEFDERRAAAARVAARMGATFVPLQDAFSAASLRAGPSRWTADGVHPTPAGHELIAEHWRAAVRL